MPGLVRSTIGACAFAVVAASAAYAQSDEATALTNRMHELIRAGRVVEAVPLAERALQMREKAFPADHPEVATSLVDLARLYELQGRSGEAEALSKRARIIYEKALQMHKPIEVAIDAGEVITADFKRLRLDAPSTAAFRIVDPHRYYVTIGAVENASQRLGPYVPMSIRRVVGERASSDVLDQTEAIDREVGRLTGEYIRDFGVAVSQIKLKWQVIDPPSRNSR